jgi:hypothetical protein
VYTKSSTLNAVPFPALQRGSAEEKGKMKKEEKGGEEIIA